MPQFNELLPNQNAGIIALLNALMQQKAAGERQSFRGIGRGIAGGVEGFVEGRQRREERERRKGEVQEGREFRRTEAGKERKSREKIEGERTAFLAGKEKTRQKEREADIVRKTRTDSLKFEAGQRTKRKELGLRERDLELRERREGRISGFQKKTAELKERGLAIRERDQKRLEGIAARLERSEDTKERQFAEKEARQMIQTLRTTERSLNNQITNIRTRLNSQANVDFAGLNERADVLQEELAATRASIEQLENLTGAGAPENLHGIMGQIFASVPGATPEQAVEVAVREVQANPQQYPRLAAFLRKSGTEGFLRVARRAHAGTGTR